MSFPAPSVTPPSGLGLWQLQFGSTVFGGSTGSNTLAAGGIKGFGMAAVSGGNVQRALDDGELIGADVYGGRDVTVQFVVKATSALALDTALESVMTDFQPGGTTEQPLWISRPSGLFVMSARAEKLDATVDNTVLQAYGALVTAMLHSTDPRLYSAPTTSTTITQATAGSGLTFPFTFPFSFGSSGGGGTGTIVNAGNREMRPTLVITGPCTNPTVSNLSVSGAPGITFDLVMAANDTLTIDMLGRTATYLASGASSASSRLNDMTQPSTWWNCPRGSNVIQFSTTDGSSTGASLAVWWASAWAG